MAPKAEPMIYLEEKSGLIKNYCVTVIKGSCYSCFNELWHVSSLQTIRIVLSSLCVLNFLALILLLKEVKILMYLYTYTSTGAILQSKSFLWESLFLFLDNPCDGSDLPSTIQYAFNLISMNSV